MPRLMSADLRLQCCRTYRGRWCASIGGEKSHAPSQELGTWSKLMSGTSIPSPHLTQVPTWLLAGLGSMIVQRISLHLLKVGCNFI